MLHGTHIIKSFDEDLDHINNDLINMLKSLLEEFDLTLEYLHDNKSSVIPKKIMEIEENLNKLNQDVLDSSLKILSLRSPVAWDLRYVFTSTHIAKRLEKSGDNIKKAIKDISNLNDKNEDINEKVVTMIKSNTVLHKRILESLESHNFSCSMFDGLKDDDIIDKTFSELCNLLLQKIQHNPDKLTSFYSYLFLGRRLEHIGDNVVSIIKLVNFIEAGSVYRLVK